MAVTHYDIDAKFLDPEWTPFTASDGSIVAWIQTNVGTSEGIVDSVANAIALGGSRKTANSSGEVSWTDLVGSDSDPEDIGLAEGTLQYKVTAEFRNPVTRKREQWSSGWFSLTADTNLADVVAEQYISATYLSQATATLDALVDEAEGYRDETQALRDGIVGDLGTTDSQTATLVSGPSLTTTALRAGYALAQGKPVGAAVGDGVADDTTALAAVLTALPAGARLDLGGLTYKTTAPLVLSKAVTLTNGHISAGAHNSVQVTAAGVTLGPGLTLSRSTSDAVTDTLSQRANLAASAPFISDGVTYSGAAHSCVYLTHALCNGTTIRGGSMSGTALIQNAAGVYAAAGATGNQNITVDGVTITGVTDGVLIFDAQDSEVRNCRVSGLRILPTVNTTGWTLVSGTVYKCRTATGTPGTTGRSTDREDGNTRVVRQSGTQLTENTSTPTNPGASKWGISGGYLYIDVGGAPSSITSDIVSGYGVTFYSTSAGFTTMSRNVVAGCKISDCDGFGIYMQLNTSPTTCLDNRTLTNTLINVCLKGVQSSTLPFAGIGWAGGVGCESNGDQIRGAGSVGFPTYGFRASDGGSICTGTATGVIVTGTTGNGGFDVASASNWTYNACTANDGSANGFYGSATVGIVIKGVQIVGCKATGNVNAGVNLATSGGGVIIATIVGGNYYSNTQHGLVLTAVRDTFVVGANIRDNGSTSFPQIRWIGDCQRCGMDNLALSHALAGASVQIATGQTTPFFYGKVSLSSNMAAPTIPTSNTYQLTGSSYITSGVNHMATYRGTGAPAIAGIAGDQYHRIDTLTTASQRIYLCTVSGAAGVATWVGVV